MIGTYVNVGTIVVGSIVGSQLKKGLKEQYTNTLMQGMGLCATALGINSITSNMGNSEMPVLFIVALALGGLIGEKLNLAGGVDKLSDKFSKYGSLEGMITGIMLFCFGTLAILGPIESALNNNHTYLFTNATLDLITSLVLASSFGISVIFAAVFLFFFQGSIYLGASVLAPFITDALMAEIGIVGGVLILCTGLSILKVVKIKTINFLPSLLIPPIYFLALSVLK